MGEWVELPMPKIVIVEGVYTLRPQLIDLIDLKIYVEANEDLRIKRHLERAENSSAWIRRWLAAEDFYVTQDNPAQQAQLIVHGGGDIKKFSPIINTKNTEH